MKTKLTFPMYVEKATGSLDDGGELIEGKARLRLQSDTDGPSVSVLVIFSAHYQCEQDLVELLRTGRDLEVTFRAVKLEP